MITIEEKDQSWPIASGSFLQWDITVDWTDYEWKKEFSYMKELGMEYLVVVASTTKDKKVLTYYPSKLEKTFSAVKDQDVFDRCLRNAEALGIKVFVGPNFHVEWWKKYCNDERWIIGQMEIGNKIAMELYENYKKKYRNAFYGWYWPYEIDNLNFKTSKQLQTLSKAINISRDFLYDMENSMPLLFSPFINSKFSTPDEYGKSLEYLFENTNFQIRDIFCPQDSIGSGGLKLKELDKWFLSFKKAVDKKPGLLFWANAENFNSSEWTSATLDRFINQMTIESKYVDTILTFSYNHYYSPNNIDVGFHKTYLEYVKTGTLDKEPPTSPEDIVITPLKMRGNYMITWKAAKDNIGICGYIVYRKGAEIFKTQVKRKIGGNQALAYEYYDKPLVGIIQYEYEVKSFDFAGNISE